MGSFTPLQALAPAKINLGLFVGPLRADGRHEIASVMQSISLADELTLEPAQGASCDQLACAGVEGPAEENLALRALAAFRKATGWSAGPVRVTVAKRVPVAAGLGGGSADAAAVLRLAAAVSRLGAEMLPEIAASLGADVPAQVRPGRWLAQGAGERLLALPDARSPFGVLVLPAGVPLATASVYAALDRDRGARSAAELDSRATALTRCLGEGEPLPVPRLLENDLQRPALSLCPAIAGLLDRAQAAGADLAMLSGSGPTVLGLYAGADGPARARRAAALIAAGMLAHAATPVGAAYGEPFPCGQPPT